MPIPQLQSKFSRREIGQSSGSFSQRSISSSDSRKPYRQPGRFLYKRNSNNPKRKLFSGLRRKFWPVLISSILILGIFCIGAFAWYSRGLPEVGKLIDRSVALSTKIYDRTGEVLLYDLHGAEQRTAIDIKNLPPYVIQATIAIEDKNFYDHGGISLWGILRGQIVPRLQGRRAQGGSTLTQQFIKNAILTDERRLSRKIREWILSYRMEQKYTKDEILQFYFNEIPYGGSAYGIESAANYYFDKPAQELTLAESAILAALPQAPTYFSPYGSNKEDLINRQHTILNLMVEQEYISAEQAEEAKNQELSFRKRVDQIKAPHFVMYIRQLLEEQYGTAIIEQSGWKIITSLDWDLQQKAQAAVDEIAPNNLERYNAGNAALVAIDVSSGDILAMIGSKDYFNDDIDGQVNVAISPRQPGSSLKPLVYLTGFLRGFRPDTILFDLATNFASAGKPYSPQNYDGQQRGPISVRQALAGSLNIPAVKMLYLAGVRNVTNLAAEFGYTTLNDPDRYGLSLVLGGGEVKLLEHTNAYAALAREGVYQDSRPILKIEDASGKTVEDYSENKGRRVIEKEPVRDLVSILSDNDARAYIFGQNNYLTLAGRPVAAKTGTTNDYHDAWTMGFTPSLATGVWVGNSNNDEMNRGADGSVVAAPIWNKFMSAALKDKPIQGFVANEKSICDKPMVCGKLANETIVKIDTVSGKLATEFTPYTTIEERKYLEVHNILHYVNAADPLGPPPTDPNLDSQYALWEEPVKKWAEEQGYLTEAPPTEYDDVHLGGNQPSVSFSTPSENQTITQGSFTAQVQTSGPRVIQRVEFFFDDQKVGQSTASPYSYNYQINPFIANGKHQIKAIAFDDQENFAQVIRSINIQLDNASRSFNLVWLDPENGDNIAVGNLPIKFNLKLDKPQNVKKIDFYYLSPDDNSHFIGFIDTPGSDVSITLSDNLSPGVYKLYMVVKDAGNNIVTTPGIIINIVP